MHFFAKKFCYIKKKQYLCIVKQKTTDMKYRELEKILKKAGCYNTGKLLNGHPKWYSPKTGKAFKMSHHGSEEVKNGTLNSILKDAGLK